LIALSIAIVAGAVAYVKESISREECARAEAEKAVALDSAESAKAKAAAEETEKAQAVKREAEAKAAAAADSRAAAEAQARAAADAKVAAEKDERAKKAAAEAAKATREAAVAKREAESAALKAAEAKKAAAKAEENAAAMKAQAAADALAAEKLRSEKVIAEAKSLEFMKIDFQTWQRDLTELEQSLAERERALRPEKTIADLAWVGGGEDMEVGEDGTVKAKKRRKYRTEDDMSLPRSSRALARAERSVAESTESDLSAVREKVIQRLERLYAAALKEDRVVDADFYRESLKSFYPDWEYRPGQHKADNVKKTKEEKK
jgi:hypothetical protein